MDRTDEKTARLKKRAPVVVHVINDARRRYPEYSDEGRKELKNTIGAAIYYLPGFPVNQKRDDNVVNHHTYPRAKAALKLLTAKEDVTVDKFCKTYKNLYGKIKYITEEKHKRCNKEKFQAKKSHYKTYEEKRRPKKTAS